MRLKSVVMCSHSLFTKTRAEPLILQRLFFSRNSTILKLIWDFSNNSKIKRIIQPFRNPFQPFWKVHWQSLCSLKVFVFWLLWFSLSFLFSFCICLNFVSFFICFTCTSSSIYIILNLSFLSRLIVNNAFPVWLILTLGVLINDIVPRALSLDTISDYLLFILLNLFILMPSWQFVKLIYVATFINTFATIRHFYIIILLIWCKE